MSTNLRSGNVSLQSVVDNLGEYDAIGDLWQTFRKTAVEPGQSSSPDFVSFADDCLLCAHIESITRSPTNSENENRDESLWDPEEGTHSPQYPLSMTPTQPPPPTSQIAGLIYLHSGPANLQGGEANIGVITKPDMQHRGCAREAIRLVLRWAFEELKFHRVQAAILDTPFRDRALRLFIGLGFSHEGTKRRAVYQPEGEGMAGMWKDVTYLAMLDTDWVLKSTWMEANRLLQSPVTSLWDEMFARHAREREELVHWEEKHGRIRRMPSTETLRECVRNVVAQDLAYLTDDASSHSDSSPPSPGPSFVMISEDVGMVDDFGPDVPRQRWEEVETSIAVRRHKQWMGSTSLDPSLQGHMLALPSIPSTRLSDGNSQSPLTISTPSTPGSTPPPLPPSPSPTPSSIRSTWSDAEDDQDWLATPHASFSRTGDARLRMRSRSSNASSVSDAWSDAQSSVGGSSGSWDVVSNARDHSLRGHA